MKTVINTSELDQTVVGIGIVKVGETVEVNDDFYNANFKEVKSKSEERRLNETLKGNKNEDKLPV